MNAQEQRPAEVVNIDDFKRDLILDAVSRAINVWRSKERERDREEHEAARAELFGEGLAPEPKSPVRPRLRLVEEKT